MVRWKTVAIVMSIDLPLHPLNNPVISIFVSSFLPFLVKHGGSHIVDIWRRDNNFDILCNSVYLRD